MRARAYVRMRVCACVEDVDEGAAADHGQGPERQQHVQIWARELAFRGQGGAGGGEVESFANSSMCRSGARARESESVSFHGRG